jgi:hypothetical protein
MAKIADLYTIHYRKDTETFQVSLNPFCGLPQRVLNEWKRRSFHAFPAEMAEYRSPKDGKKAKAAATALIIHLKKKLDEDGSARRSSVEDITVGAWIQKFTELETSPRTGINAARNKPFSLNTLDGYKGFFKLHVKDDPICRLKMAEVEEEDVLEFITRLSVSKLKDGRPMVGTRKFAMVVSFVRMAFNAYQRKSKTSTNPFQYIEKPVFHRTVRNALTQDEVIKLFMPGVLTDTMDLAVCSVLFLSGLRRAEVSALRPEDLDWATPQIIVCRSWQRFNYKNKVLGPTKGKNREKRRLIPSCRRL